MAVISINNDQRAASLRLYAVLCGLCGVAHRPHRPPRYGHSAHSSDKDCYGLRRTTTSDVASVSSDIAHAYKLGVFAKRVGVPSMVVVPGADPGEVPFVGTAAIKQSDMRRGLAGIVAALDLTVVGLSAAHVLELLVQVVNLVAGVGASATDILYHDAIVVVEDLYLRHLLLELRMQHRAW